MSIFNELKFLFNSTPPYFIYWVTQNCNFTCDHCFNYLENRKDNEDLSLEEVDRFSRKLGHLKYVTLAGGEPMLRKDLAQIARIFYVNNGLQMANVVTNGWFTQDTVAFARMLLEQCPRLNVAINVSIDGEREIHDRIRRKKGSFERAVQTLRMLKKIHDGPTGKRLSLSATGTYHAENAKSILDVANFMARELGLPYFITLIRGQDIQNRALKNVDIEHYRWVSNRLHRLNQARFSAHYPFRRVRLAVYQTVADIIYRSFKYGTMTVPCKAGIRGFVMTAAGDILLCEVLDTRLGNIRENGYDPVKILNGPAAVEIKRRIVAGKCHCTWECFQTMNTVFSPAMYPTVARHMIKNICNCSGRQNSESRSQNEGINDEI